MKHLKLFTVMLTILLLAACGGDDNTRIQQTISFDPLLPHNLSEGSFRLSATASSGLPVTFASSDPTVASINGETVTLHRKGTVTVTATQPGNDSYFEAPAINRDLVINEDNNPDKQDQTITFELNVVSLNYLDARTLTLEATASSGLPVTFSSNHRFVRINGNVLELLYEGEHYDDNATITASQAGNDEYNAAPNVSRTLRVIHEDK
ncbi:MAG: Ig-like domain-containing protein [Prevotellaceae bacterium]|jgi:hypothetical protein|nr:Ig-like domain-containing protein [Prevotellaceae bacterium]